MPQPDTITPPTAEIAPPTPTAAQAQRRDGARRPVVVFGALAAVTISSVALFLTWGVDGHWDYALPRRLEQLVALTVVGVAVAVSTVVFQTLTENRILTPAIMGFDALYVLLATTLVFALGAPRVAELPGLLMFGVNTALLVTVATLGYRWVLGDSSRGLYTLVLVGVIASTLFGSLTSFMFRVMDPNEFDTLMTVLFASFNVIDTTALRVAAVLLVIGIITAIRMVPTLDVLTLGRDAAIGLGVEYRATVTRLLIVVAGLVAVSTALVGPIVFLGLLVANLAYQLTRSQRHAVTLPAAALIAVSALVLGQAVLQHVLHFNATLGSIINLVGGVYFVGLLVTESRS